MMKKLWLSLIFLLFASLAYGQQGAQLSITDIGCTTAAPCTVIVYRAPGSCPTSGIGTLTYASVATLASGTSWAWTDPGPLAAGTYCYYTEATFVSGGAASSPSNTFPKTVQTSPPPPPVVIGK